MTHLSTSDDGADHGERTERRWATAAVMILALLVVVATFAALYHGAMPQSRVETADPRTLHLGGEFIESNLGSVLDPDGAVTVRFIASNTRSPRHASSYRPIRRSRSARPAPTWCMAS